MFSKFFGIVADLPANYKNNIRSHTTFTYIPQMSTSCHIHFVILCISISFLKYLRVSCRYAAPLPIDTFKCFMS